MDEKTGFLGWLARGRPGDIKNVGDIKRGGEAGRGGGKRKAGGADGRPGAGEGRARLAYSERDNFFDLGGSLVRDGRDRAPYDREETLRLALEAWRTNPLARRIVSLTTEYVVGGGLTLTCRHKGTARFLQTWWEHPLNLLAQQAPEWCDELTRSGELFFLLSTDAAGMTYVRAVPAYQIEEIITAENDLRQETAYRQKHADAPGLLDGPTWPAYDPADDAPGPGGAFKTVMLHFAVNRPAGAVRGESDLAPLLKWLARYSAWLEDRARLNRFRQAFVYVVTGRFASEAERAARQQTLNANPPNPGSILVTDEGETWSVVNPLLASDDAMQDGLALKKMIATGAGLPLHFLAEPEQANRATAESAGGPTFRHFQQRQEFFTWMVGELARAAVRRRAVVSRSLSWQVPVEVSGADISARDNASLAEASARVIEAFAHLRELGLIDDGELLRLAYRFAGEAADVPALLERARGAPRDGASRGELAASDVEGTAPPDPDLPGVWDAW